jgi:hypothetical protein
MLGSTTDSFESKLVFTGEATEQISQMGLQLPAIDELLKFYSDEYRCMRRKLLAE